MENRLISEKSPYLLQHAHNPVDWYPWGGEAFEKAKQEEKPVFLSIGYSTCHWCHVMEKESFEDEEIAKLLNDSYVAIKVDREERPDIDMVYMEVCREMTGQGGWPLTIIMTPEQKPFFAGTYFPKKTKYGMNGLEELLREIAYDWSTRREEILRLSDRVTGHLYRNPVRRAADDEPDKDVLREAVQLFEERYDETYGGFGEAPKFPTPHNLLFLMRYAQLEGCEKAADMAYRTLEAMYRGGIFDHVGGGFARYSTDDQWLIPHFEKMLYDNALLIYAYLEAYQMTKKSLFRTVAVKTLDYVLRELTDGNGGFYCGQDADCEGEEGKYYRFSKEEILEILGEENGQVVCRWFHIEDGVFNLIRNEEFETVNPRIESAVQKLLAYRESRMKLHRDDKILTGWNGLMIAALAKAYQVLGEKKYLSAARKAQGFLEERLTDPDGRLRVRYRDNHVAGTGTLDDYAFTAFGFLELYRAGFDIRDLAKALELAKQMISLFWDKEAGGLYFSASDAEKLITRPKETYDGAVPSGNAAAAYLFVQLAHLTGETVWAEKSRRQLKFLNGELKEYPAGYSFTLLALLEELYAYRDLVCTAPSLEETEPLAEKLRERFRGNLAVLVKTAQNREEVDRLAPFTADYEIPESGALYYMCQDGACMPPINHLEGLEYFS